MIHGFYFRFLNIVHSEYVSCLLAKCAYFIYLIKYSFERACCRKRIVQGDVEEARKRLQQLHADPGSRPVVANAELDPAIDLSIIIPIYNYVNLIEENIESVLNQKTTYRFELILVDDGSTDGAQEIVRRYTNKPRVKTIFQKNQGIASARNTGLNQAVGRYIMFVDCDDVVEPDLVETLMNKAMQDDCDIVMCAHRLVKERDGKIYATIPNVYSDANLAGYYGNAKILNYAGLPWAKVYKRELWERVRFLPGYWYEDTIIQALLFTQCKRFAYIPKICYQYRWYEKNFSHIQGNRLNPKCVDRYWMLVPILEKAKELGVNHGEGYYTMLIKHLSAYYYPTIEEMGEQVIEDMFILACDLLKKYGMQETIKLPYMLKVTEKALKTRNINLWKLATKYQ